MQTMVLTGPRVVLALVVAAAGLAGGGVLARNGQDPLGLDLFARASIDKYRHVMFIGPGATPGSIRVLTRHDVQEFNARGERVSVAPFPDELWRPFPARIHPDAPERVFGLRSGTWRSWVDVLETSGARVRKLRSWSDGVVEVANVLGDEANEVLVRYQDGVAVLDEAGKRLAFVKSPRYLYHFRTIQVPGDAHRAIAMWMWLDDNVGTDVAVVRADGRTVGAWREKPSERLAAFALDGAEEGLWSAVDGRFFERTATGAIKRTLLAPGMQKFRYVYGGRLAGGHKVLIGASGGFDTGQGSLVCLFDAHGAFIASSPLPQVVWTLYVPDPDGTVFFVGNGENILRYDVSHLVRPAPR